MWNFKNKISLNTIKIKAIEVLRVSQCLIIILA